MTVPLNQAMLDPALFGHSFGGPTFAAWRSVAKMLDGLPLDEDELALWCRITSRDAPPTVAFREAYLIKPRRAGGTLFAAALGLHAALQDYRDRLGRGEVATVAMIACDRRQARQLMNYCEGLIADSPMIAAEVSGRTQETISFAHRVNLEVHTTSFRSTRGYSYAAVILDEMAFFRDDLSANPDIELVRAVRPGLANLGGRLLGLSSPHSRRGHLYAMWQQHYGRPSDVLVIQAGGPTLNPTINAAVIDRARAEDPVAARSEWDAQFREDISQYLTDELIEAAMPGRLKRGPRLSSVAFVDMSGGVSDSAALGIAHSETVDGVVQIRVDHLEVVPAPHKPSEVAERFAATLKRLGLSRVTGDRYAAGWCAGAFEQHGIQYESAELDKSAIYGEVLPLFSEQRVEIPDDQRLISELRLLERKPRAGGRPDNVDHPPRAHDDAANAVAGALWLAAKESTTLERPGALIKIRGLLAGARRVLSTAGAAGSQETSPRPVPMPRHCRGVFATVAAGVGTDPSAVGVVMFAWHSEPTRTLTVIDWDLFELDSDVIAALSDAVAERLGELREEIHPGSWQSRIMIEPDGIGRTLIERGEAGGFDVVAAPESVCEKSHAERVIAASAYLNSGDVRIAQAAYDKTATYKGVTRNHLLNQLTAFGAGDESKPDALLVATANVVLDFFETR